MSKLNEAKKAEEVKCSVITLCADYPTLCDQCARNKAKRHFFKPAVID